MKKTIALALAAVMLLSPLASTARAMEPFRQERRQVTLTEGKKSSRSKSNRHRDYRHDRDRRRHHSSGGGILGAAIGGLIVGSIIGAASSGSSASSCQPTMYCDAYGNCWYQ